MTTVLKGTPALKLFVQGSEKWNEWVKANPSASVDFTGIKFFKLPEQYKPISFAEYLFPSGDISFDFAEFGDGDVSFENATFGNGKISFYNATFGTGNVSFEFCHFGSGDLSFENTQFGEGNVIFHCTEFNNGDVNFTKSSFGNGDISFFGAQFGRGTIDFSASQYEEGDLGFIYTKFGEGDFRFNHVQLQQRNVLFREAQSPQGQFQISKTAFTLPLDLSDLKNSESITHLSLQGSQFKGGLDISRLKLKNPVNLINTTCPSGIEMNELVCDFEAENAAKEGFIARYRKARHKTATVYFSRLRDLAQQSNDVVAEQTFNRKERLTARWQTLNPLQSLFDVAFEWLCDYGRSARMPLLIIAVMALMNFGSLALLSSDNKDCQNISKILGTGITVTVPFAGPSGIVKNDWLNQCTASKGSRDNVQLLFSVTGVISTFMFICLFFTIFTRYQLRTPAPINSNKK